jgi:hypothetical protein
MQMLIIGLNHQIQPAEIKSGSSSGRLEAFERDQKERFASLLGSNIAKRNARFVAEEARHGEESIAKRVCDSVNCRYLNVEMTPEERVVRNIPPGYEEDKSFPLADKDRCHRERETYMVQKTLAAAADAESTIVICGRMHSQPLANSFREAGHTVDTVDLLDQSWYIEDWFEHMYRL